MKKTLRPESAPKGDSRPAPTGDPRRRHLEWLGLALIGLTMIVVYSPAFHGQMLWDDDGHITQPSLQSIGGLYRIWFDIGATQQYYPLLHSAFWLEHKLWGDSMLGYHLVNVFWHFMAVVLLFSVLTKLEIRGALLAAAIFALHPVMVESVAWVSEQKNTLSAVLYLSAMLAYLHYNQSNNTLGQTGESLPPNSRHRVSYFLSLAFFTLGLLTKTVTATLPAALLVIIWWQRGTLSLRRDVRPLIPFFVLGAAAGLLTAWFERKLIGAEGADFDLTIIQRGLIAGRVVWFYLGKLVWPAELTFVYPRWTIDPAVWWQWLFPIATLAVTIAFWALRRKSRALLAGWLLFVGTLFPVMGFLNVYPFIFSYVADHFQYLASLGVITLAAAGIATALARLARPARRVGGTLCVVLLGTLAGLSFRQAHMYADNFTLYRTTLARNPDCWMAHNNLGELLAKSKPAEAMAHYNEALRLYPDNPAAHNNLGLALIQAGEHERAIEHLQQAVRVKPDYATAHNNLGIALHRSGRIPEATEEFRTALKINPNDAMAHANYAYVVSMAGQIDDAIAHYTEAILLRPNFADAHSRLADILRQLGHIQRAIDHYKAALESQPDLVEVYADLAQAQALANQPQNALATAQEGIEVARSTGQQAAADRLEQWLKHFTTELRPAK